MTDPADEIEALLAKATRRINAFQEAVVTLPFIVNRLDEGDQFNAYERASNDEDCDDDDRKFCIGVGPLNDFDYLFDIQGKRKADLVEAALKLGTDAPALLAELRTLRATLTIRDAQLVEAVEALRPFAVLGAMLDGPFGIALFPDDQSPLLREGEWRENGEPRTITFGDLRRSAASVARIEAER